MSEEPARRFGRVGGSIAASLALHAVLFSLFFVQLPVTLPEPEQEEAVAVQIVPPPEEKPPEEEAPAPAEPEEAEAEEAAQAEEQQPEQASEEVPEPPPAADEAEAEAEVTPAPAEAVEDAPPPEQQQMAAAPPTPVEGEGRRMPFPALNPVFEFGEQDRGPREALDGNGAEDGAETAPEPETVEEEQASEAGRGADETEAVTPEEPADAASEDTAGAEDPAETALAEPSTDDPTGLGIDILSSGTSDSGISFGIAAAGTDEQEAGQPATPEAPPLDEKKQLFSRALTDDPRAVTAMADIPRGVRADQLCITELREQLRRGSPRYRPELLPSYKLGEGTRFEIRDAAFRSEGRWYDLSYRCEINEEATKVLSFALRVGAPIPRSQWAERKLPAY